MKLVRFIDSDKVRQLCIDWGFYTRGDCRSYDHLLNDLCSDSGHYKEVSDSDIEDIARDITDHSDRKAFEETTENTTFLGCLRIVITLIANNCCIFSIEDL